MNTNPKRLRRTTAALICALSVISLSWLAWPAQAKKAARNAATPAGQAGKRWNADQVPSGLTAEDWHQIQQAVAASGQPDTLQGSNTEGGDQFGWSVGISGDTVVVGAPYEDSDATGVNGNQGNNSNNGYSYNSGAAYIFVRNGTSWSQQAYLKPHNTSRGNLFGHSVAISGDRVVVGAPGQDYGAGRAYVFERNGTSWRQQGYLIASNVPQRDSDGANIDDRFGHSVAIYGNTVVVGAPLEDSNGTGVNGNQNNNSALNSGAAYVFVGSGTSWFQQAYLKPSNTGANDNFGSSVAIYLDTVVVGAPNEDSNGTGVNGNQSNNSAVNSGAAYVFLRSNGLFWSQQAYLKASNTGADDQFGWSVAISGNTVVVGAPNEDSDATGVNGNQSNNSALNSGAAYVFLRNGVSWSQQAYLKASNTGADDQFGWSVAISGTTVSVGAPKEDSSCFGGNVDPSDNGDPNSGADYVFMRSGASWNQSAFLKIPTYDGPASFGYSAALFGDTLVVGGFGGERGGAAYFYSGLTSAEINVELSPGTPLTDGKSIISFGTVAVGSSSAARTFTIRNDGKAALTGLAITTVGANAADFILDTIGMPTSLSPGSSANFTVTFAPSASVGSGASISIASNDTDESPFDIGLLGNVGTPTINTVANARQQCSPVSNSTIATVSQGTLILRVNGGSSATVNGVTVSNLANRDGRITANIVADCTATDASFTLSVTDIFNRIATATLNVRVTANDAPTIGDYPNTTVSLGANTTIMPSAAPIITTSVSVSAPADFKGTFAADPVTGVVQVTNAYPAGVYTVTVNAFEVGAVRTFTLTVQTGLFCGSPTFTNAADIGVGANPQSAAVGDFNGDGIQDLAIANFGSNNVSILLGNGAGAFGGAKNISVGASPYSVAVGDFNGDGKQDLIVITDNSALILLGNGAGGFSGPSYINGGNKTRSVAVGDFNGDGRQDLAVAISGSNNVMVLLGRGGVVFSFATNVSVGASPYSVAVGDFNGDGKQDLAVANNGSNNVSILLGNGLGSFSSATNISVGTGPQSVVAGDFNGDGKQDLATANFGSKNVSVLLGNGAGGFSGATNIGVGTKPYSVAVGDFNGDGKQDLAVANSGSNNVSIRLGNGAGGFSSATNISVGTGPQSVTVGDFNGDGKQDLAVANNGTNNISIRLGGCANTSPAISAADSLTRQEGSLAISSKIATVSDADQAAQVAGESDGERQSRDAEIEWQIVVGNEGETQSVLRGGSGAPYFDVVVPGDYDGDGVTDFAIFRRANGHWLIKRSRDGGLIQLQWGLGSDLPVAADYDGDGKTDIAVWRGTTGQWFILRSSDGAQQVMVLGNGLAPFNDLPAPSDYDGDGKADVAVWRASEGKLYVLGSASNSVIIKTGDAPRR